MGEVLSGQCGGYLRELHFISGWRREAGAVLQGLTPRGAGSGFSITQVLVSFFPESVWNAGSGAGQSP